MANNEICVSYQDDGVWKYVEKDLKAHLPLRNVLYKTKTGGTRIIDKLNLQLLPYDDERLQFTPQATNWYKEPFLHIYLVQCEDSDKYKQLVKGKIKAWLDAMPKDHEWLIIYVSRRVSNELMSKLQLYTTVYDKIRKDFNVKNTKRDRCCQLQIQDDGNKKDKMEESWDDIISKMKEGIVASIQFNISRYEQAIEKMEKSKLANYYQYFFLKECMAFIYERSHMLEEALVQYDELEKLFADAPKQQGKFGGSDPGDDAATFLNEEPKKNIRDMIYQNTITEFDFRQYLFGRQCRLLFALKRPAAVAERAMTFISTIAKLGKNVFNNPSNPYFREAWVFSAAVTTVDACTKSPTASLSPPSTPSKQPPSTPQPFQRFISVLSNLNLDNADGQPDAPATPGGPSDPNNNNNNSSMKASDSVTKEYMDCLIADLIHQALSRLYVLGKELGLLPKNESFESRHTPIDTNTNTTQADSTEAPPKVTFTNATLQEATQSESSFDKLFIDMTQKAVGLYTAANRLRSVARLNFDVANLHYHRSRWEKAEPLLKAVSTTYKTDGWYSLEYNARTLLAECERRLAHMSDYVSDCLALLAPNLPLVDSERLLYVEKLNKHAADLSPPLVRDMAPIFTTTINFLEDKYTLGSTIQARCDIVSTLPTAITVAKITLHMTMNNSTTTPILQRSTSSSLFSPRRVSMSASTAILPVTPSTPSNSLNPPNPPPAPALPSPTTPAIPPSTSEESISITMQNITLQPGPNSFILEREAKLKGQFVSDNVKLELGQLVLRHQILQRSVINVTESISQAAMVMKAPISLLLKVVQHVLITITTGSDSLINATLSVRSATGMQILESAEDTLVIVRNANSDNTPGAIVSCQKKTLAGGKLELAALNADIFVEVYIPILANNSQPCVHQMRAELVHEKRTKEIFFLASSVALPFAHAFSATTVCAPFNATTTLVQAILTSTAGAPLTILNYGIKEPNVVQQDPNTHVKNSVILPNQNISLVFCVAKLDQPSRDITLDVSVSLPSVFSTTVDNKKFPTTLEHAFSTNLTLSLPSPQFIIETRTPPSAYLTQPIPFELVISQVVTNTPITEVLVEIEEDPLWIISGKRRANLQLSTETATTLSCRMRPITAGIVPVPKVRLCDVPQTSFSVSSKGPSHVQVFPEPITVECTPIDV